MQIINFEGVPGSVGRVPRYLERLFGVKLVKFDIEAQEVVRNTKGYLHRMRAGRSGRGYWDEITSDPEAARGRFEGYADASETETRILRNVFEKGDAWFRTGDLLKKDKDGNYYFVDRAGDTFRWKGENVSTSEVAQVLSAFPGVKEANVYGVRVPGADGRAGMAALVVEETIDLNGLHKHLERELPAYARPLFLARAAGNLGHEHLQAAQAGARRTRASTRAVSRSRSFSIIRRCTAMFRLRSKWFATSKWAKCACNVRFERPAGRSLQGPENSAGCRRAASLLSSKIKDLSGGCLARPLQDSAS